MTFKFKPFRFTAILLLSTFMLIGIPILIYIFFRENAPIKYYGIILFQVGFPLVFYISYKDDTTSLIIDSSNKLMVVKTRFNTKKYIVPFEQITGYSLSITRFVKNPFSSSTILLYTEKKNFEIPKFNIFSYNKLEGALNELNIKCLGDEPYLMSFVGRVFKYEKQDIKERNGD